MIKGKKLIISITLSLLVLTVAATIVTFKGRADPARISGFVAQDFNLPFSILTPDKVYAMPHKLKEISGLTLHNEHQAYCVNDEKGVLYLFDFDLGKIISEYKFGKNGDYESLTRIDDLIYVGESNGNIKIINTSQEGKTDEIKTPLSIRNDVEGICYDSSQNQLLIACKGQPEKAKKHKGKKGIYSFSLSDESFDKSPYLLIDLNKELQTLNPINLGNSIIQKWSFNSRIGMFAPSGLAIDPITSQLYVLANNGKILLVFDKQKNLLATYFLDQKLHAQPEGIIFDQKGNLYISNEGRSASANIVYFKRKNI